MISKLVRKNILTLKPYSSARDESKLPATIFLDANENPLGSPGGGDYNRYPDPRHKHLREAVSALKGVPASGIFLGNGSDEIIDLALRIFCEPGIDDVIICPPTYGMYEVSAQINDVGVKKVMLTADFQLDVSNILKAVDEQTKIIFLCSPNNPTGNTVRKEDVESLLNRFQGVLVVDEAYVDFADEESFLKLIEKSDRLLVMQTFSKAWGLAGLRVGMAFGQPDLLEWFWKVKPPYNINLESQRLVLNALGAKETFRQQVEILLRERERLADELGTFSFVKKVFAGQANFLLVRVANATELYDYLARGGIVVRNRTNDPLCENCIRITVGAPGENDSLIEELKKYEKSLVY